jgi:hypothetical protein
VTANGGWQNDALIGRRTIIGMPLIARRRSFGMYWAIGAFIAIF